MVNDVVLVPLLAVLTLLRLQPDARLKPGSTVLRDREALVRVVRTGGEGMMQAGSLHHSFPARSAPSGWDRPTGKKRSPIRTGSGLASRTRCNARAKRWIQA